MIRNFTDPKTKEKLTLFSSEYGINGATYFGLRTENGEPYADVTTNLLGCTDKTTIALNHDFESFCPELANIVLEELCITNRIYDMVCSGFNTYPIWKLKKEVVDELRGE